MTDFPAPIIFISNAGLAYGLPTNRQQLPRRLAEFTPVLYAAPFSLSQAMAGRVPFSGYRPGAQQIGRNLVQYQYLQFMPMVRGENTPLKRLDERLARLMLRRQVARLGMKKAVLWLYYPPSFRYLVGHLGEVLTVYHCTDDHAGYARVVGRDSQRVADQERELLEAADVVFTTSRPLYEAKRQVNPNTYLMPNVADVSHFKPVALGQVSAAAELDPIRRPIAGFIGAVSSYKVDLQLLREVASILKTWNFVFVGPVGLGDDTGQNDLPRLPNMHFLGRRPHDQLPAYLAGFDVCLIPYRVNSYTNGVFPLKLWEYLAAGKPVVATHLPALEEQTPAISLAAGAQEFAAAIEREGAADDDERSKARLALATNQSWERRAGEMLSVLKEYL